MRRTLIGAGVLLVLATGACAKSGKQQVNTATAPVTMPGSTNDHGSTDLSGMGGSAEVTVAQHDFYFGPTFIKASSGARVKITVRNMGSVEHTFTSSALGLDHALMPGQSYTVTITVPNSPALFYCRFHQASGMQGAFY